LLEDMGICDDDTWLLNAVGKQTTSSVHVLASALSDTVECVETAKSSESACVNPDVRNTSHARELCDELLQARVALRSALSEVETVRADVQHARSELVRAAEELRAICQAQKLEERISSIPDCSDVQHLCGADHSTSTMQSECDAVVTRAANEIRAQFQTALAAMCQRLESCERELQEASSLTREDLSWRIRVYACEAKLEETLEAMKAETISWQRERREYNVAQTLMQDRLDAIDSRLFTVSTTVRSSARSKEHEYTHSSNPNPLQSSLQHIHISDKRATNRIQSSPPGNNGGSSFPRHYTESSDVQRKME